MNGTLGLAAAVALGACSGGEVTDDAELAPVSAPVTAGGTGTIDPLCVDAGRYQPTSGLVYDRKDGHLVWERKVARRLPQPAAVAYCASLSIEGIQGFRLPTPPELGAIRYKPGGLFGDSGHTHYCIPSIDQVAFPDTPAEQFWTSRAQPDGTAWYVGFDDGRSHRDEQSEPLWVRCVHDPLP